SLCKLFRTCPAGDIASRHRDSPNTTRVLTLRGCANGIALARRTIGRGADAVSFICSETHLMRIASFISLFTFLVALGQPSTARADVLITPFAGVSFIDDDSKRNFGASIGFGGLIGFEVDASQTRIGSYEEVPLV